MAIETEIAREMSCRVRLGTTLEQRESGRCATPQAVVEPASAWSDGTNWIDQDGTEVGWVDWPPGGIEQ